MNPALAYHTYLGPALFAPHAAITLAAAAIAPAERVLDVACGTGIVTARVRAARVVGLDVNPAMLAIAREAGLETVQASALAMPLADASFEVVLCQQGLQFFPDRAAGARELRRVCAHRAVVACWGPLASQGFFADIVEAQARHLGLGIDQAGVPFTLADAGALAALLREAGFAHVDVATHRLDVQFPDPPRFVRMCVEAALAVMPDRFGAVEPAAFGAAIAADVRASLARYTEGDHLRFPMTTNVAVAFV
jgi:SAM-dependent methyltransferase